MSTVISGLQESKNQSGNLQNATYAKKAQAKFSSAQINQGLKDEYQASVRKRGLLEKLFAKFADLSPFGVSSKTINIALKFNSMGKVPDEKVRESIKRQENSIALGTDIAISTASIATAMSVGFAGKKLSGLIDSFSKKLSGKAKLITAISSFTAGFGMNFALKSINRIGKPKDAKSKNDLKDTTLSSLMSGVGGYASLLSPFLLPVAFVSSLVLNHFNSEKRGNDNNFLRNIKDNLGILTVSAATLGYIGAKGHINFAKIAETSKKVGLNKSHTYLYTPPKDQLTEFQQLARDIGYDLSILVKDGKVNPKGIAKLDEDFIKILMEKGQNGQIESKIKKLEEENIFLPKYLQTVIDIPDSLQKKIM